MQMVGDIAGPVDVSRAGAAPLVDENPVVLGHGRACDRGHVRLDPDANDGEVAPDPIPVGQHHRLQPLGPLERGNLRSGEQPDALGAVNPADQGAELLAEDPLQRVPARKDRGDLDPELGQGGRHLAADEPHAHHHRTPSRHGLMPDRVALGHRPQVVDSGQLGPGNLQPPVPSSRRDQELPVRQVPARAEGQLGAAGSTATTESVRSSTSLASYQPLRSPSDRR
jgi:hypothetical protein